MVTIVGQDKITAKRDLRDIFPKEFANRLLINEFITYILNNFFEKSAEKIVNGFVGEVVPSIDGTECYISEPSTERSINQIIPVLKNDTQNITYQNFIADLHNEGVKIFDENKLITSKYWSWCPPINVDMFINPYNYYWIGWDYKEKDTIILTGKVDVSSLIGQSDPIYYEYDEEGEVIEHIFKNGERIVFTNDTSNIYNFIPYEVSGLNDVHSGSFKLTSTKMPLIVLDGKTNIANDIEGKTEYTYINEDHGLNINLKNGMRLMFINDENNEYNYIPFIVSGVGESIKMIDDSYDPYEYYYKRDIDLYYKLVTKPDYFVMERGCIDGNEWSIKNRWVNVKALEEFNADSIESKGRHGLYHASMPIMCYNKDIELYNYGTFDRGYIVAKTSILINNLNNKSIDEVKRLLGVDIKENDNILIAKENDTNPNHLYKVLLSKTKTNTKVILKPLKNGQTADGSSVKGDVVKLNKNGKIISYYFDGLNWIEGQIKNKINYTDVVFNGFNQNPLFNLYDSDKVLLSNKAVYPNSTFNGNKLFDYKEATEETGDYSGNGYISSKEKTDENIISYGLDRYIEIDGDSKNYIFENHIHSDSYNYLPENSYEKEIEGYKFFKINGKDEYLNDWYLSKNNSEQYIKTKVEANVSENFVSPFNDDEIYYKVDLAYTPSESSSKSSLIVYNNGIYINKINIKIDKDDKNIIYIKNVNKDDVLDINLLTDEDIEELDSNYTFELPLSLSRNQYNEEIETIGYNNCFDQMIDIMESQIGFDGIGSGYNNYYQLKPDLSLGTKIIQNSSSIIRSMILDDEPNTSIRASIEYVKNAYDKFKIKFINLLNQYYIKGLILEDNKNQYETEEESMDDVIKEIINKINVGKEGLMPFYNNGVIHLLENAYIPSTPSYLGITNCYEPKIITFDEYIGENKPTVILGHDGSLTKATETVKDLFIKRLEDLIYGSINSKFKDTRCGINKYKFMPGFFRKNTYTREEVIDTYSTFIDSWANDNGIDYSENLNFDYDTIANPEAWKTWNYTGTFTPDGDELNGSYRAVYTYYYDTYRPDTHPWEMLGFGDKPSWWEDEYGSAPYTSENIIMWQDIENGIIKNGESKGEYEELKRPGLIDKYMPVDENGKLKSPSEIGIIKDIPMIQQARARWKIGDIGDVEFAYMQTSTFKYIEQLLMYLLRPVEWVETNWNTINRDVLFKGTDYEQVVDSSTKKRENIKNMIMHNEYIDGQYIRNIGVQQWISDYALSNKLSITGIADKIRNSEVNLGYRCAGFFEKDTLNISTDAYGELPKENIHTSLFKTKMNDLLTYSAMLIKKTKKGYTIDGFDKSFPYFNVRKPIINGKKSTYESDGVGVYYYLTWSDDVEQVPYKTEFTTIQDVYNVINGYGKYLEDNEGWYFNTRNGSGVILNWRTSGESFVQWATVQKGESTDGNIILLNPGVIGLGVYNNGMIEDLNLKTCGYDSVLDINGNPVEAKDMNVFRQSFNTYIQPKNSNIALVKLKKYLLEHLITLDNETIYGDTIYASKYYTILGRFNLSCVKVKNWYGTIYAPGYLLTDDGAIQNFDKSANDLQYMFDVDDAKCQAEYAEYSRNIIGYNRTKTYIDLMKNDKAMFDFYKGAIREKGTREVLNKINRSSYVSSTGNNIDIYESWLFKAGEFGHTKNDSCLEFLLDMKKMKNNPQIITFEVADNYYYDENETYNVGNVVIYNNYEYTCLYNNVTGKFNPTDWKQNRYVGNYIIFNNDENWIKKQKNQKLNGFSYSNNLALNPIGGFAQLNDADYIAANETEFDLIKDTVSVGETVWVVKLKNGDWDIRKKTGINKFVSMRYPTLADAYEKNEEDLVYHFSDNKKDYYVASDSNNIELTDNVYNDVDINDDVCKWKDIGYPEFKKQVDDHVSGTDYKVKLYNTVFKTQVPESSLNSDSIFTQLNSSESDPKFTYSSLLLNMTQFGKNSLKYRWCLNLTVQTDAGNVKVEFGQDEKDENGVVTFNPTNTYYSKDTYIVVSEGNVIHWRVSATGCGYEEGILYIPPVAPDELIKEVTEFPENPVDGEQICLNGIYYCYSNTYYDYANKKSHWILLGKYSTERQLDITVHLRYKEGEIVLEHVNPESNVELLLPYSGTYRVDLVGAGGGAGGGYTYVKKIKKKFGWAYKATAAIVSVAISYVTAGYGAPIGAAAGSYIVKQSKKKKTYYYTGNGGGSGAYLKALINIDEHTNTNNHRKYYITSGNGGSGGSYKRDGFSGGDSILYRTDYGVETNVLIAHGGRGGSYGNSSMKGFGGDYYADYDTNIIETTNGSKSGNNGGIATYGGASVYPDKNNYGAGGDPIKNTGKESDLSGKPGVKGYALVRVVSVNEHTTVKYNSLTYISAENGTSDSTDYSSYYQPFVVIPKNKDITYFYSYDVLKYDPLRPDANIISGATKFYKNRCRPIIGKHYSNAANGYWEENKLYEEGYKVLDELNYTYICIEEHTSGTSFDDNKWAKCDIDAIEKNWESQYDYVKGNKVLYNNILYICKEDHTSGTSFDDDKWIRYNNDDITEEWTANTEYKINDKICIDIEGRHYIYNCIKDHISGEEFSENSSIDDEIITVWVRYNTNVIKNLWYGEKGRKYNLGDTITYQGKYYICRTEHVCDGEWKLKDSNDNIIWEEYLPTYYYKINYNNSPEYDNFKLKSATPHYEKDGTIYNLELYEDENCTSNVTTNSYNVDNPEAKFMTVYDLLDGYEIETSYKLVDQFTTYFQLMPRYLNEPSWGLINQLGTYPIYSGEIEYYVQLSKPSMDKYTTLLVYDSETCLNSIKMVKAILKDISPSPEDKEYEYNYDTVDMKYEDLIKVITNHFEPTYMYEDNGLVLYSSNQHLHKDKKELYDTPVYFNLDVREDDETVEDGEIKPKYLMNEAGIYGDYVPQWEKMVYIPNPYINEIKYIESNEDIETKNYSIDLYTDQNCENKLNETLYVEFINKYGEYENTKKKFIPSYADETGLVYKSSLNDSNENIILIYEDGTKYDGELYVKMEYHESTLYAGELTKKYIIKDLKTKEEKECFKSEYKEQEINDTYDIYNPKSNNINDNVKLYYNEQSVGQCINSNEIIVDSNKEEDIMITFNNIEDDPVYQFIEEINEDFINRTEENPYTEEDVIEAVNELFIKNSSRRNYYVNYNEIVSIYDLWFNGDDEHPAHSKVNGMLEDYSENHFRTHTCKVFDTYRNEKIEKNNYYDSSSSSSSFSSSSSDIFDIINEDNENIEYVKTYYKLYMLGSYLYVSKQIVIDDVNIKLCGLKIGCLTENNNSNINSIEEVSKYIRNEIEDYSEDKIYNIDDLCIYKPDEKSNDVCYICLENNVTGEFDINYWDIYTKDKVVNSVIYKTPGDKLFITNDSYKQSIIIDKKEISNIMSDTNNVANIPGTYGSMNDEGLIDKKGWMKIEYLNKDYIFNLLAAQRLRIATDNIKSCYLVDNDNDKTIIKVQVYDPIQNIIPNNVLSEVNYISSTDPVVDYEDSGRWNDNKIGYLWWDTSKVRYVDYYQGDYDYRAQNWGKQLPGSEIVINEWTRSSEIPEDGRNYITRTLYDNNLASYITYYYYWEKNPVEVPNVSFRKNSALVIASVINNPFEEGIVWMSPVDTNSSDKYENTLILSNYNNVLSGQNAVLQINMDSDNDILSHSEWASVLENADNGEIPDFLWVKMKDSLLGYKNIDGKYVIVPDKNLNKNEKLGINYRPRQTMFNNLYDARENFIDIINSIFSNRTYDQISKDVDSWLIVPDENRPVNDMPDENEYDDVADNKLEMMSWKDPGLIGQKVLVNHDETHNGIWAIYEIESGWNYKLIDYQKFNINNYLTLKDWYDNNEVKYINPTFTVSTTSADAIALCKTLDEGKIVKYIDEDGNWELYQLINNEGILEVKLVGKSSTIIHISDDIYDYVNNTSLDDTLPYIDLIEGNKEDVEYSEVYESNVEPENPSDLMYWYDTENNKLFRYYASLNEWVEGYSITRYEYEFNQSQYLLEKLIEYFEG